MLPPPAQAYQPLYGQSGPLERPVQAAFEPSPPSEHPSGRISPVDSPYDLSTVACAEAPPSYASEAPAYDGRGDRRDDKHGGV